MMAVLLVALATLVLISIGILIACLCETIDIIRERRSVAECLRRHGPRVKGRDDDLS